MISKWFSVSISKTFILLCRFDMRDWKIVSLSDSSGIIIHKSCSYQCLGFIIGVAAIKEWTPQSHVSDVILEILVISFLYKAHSSASFPVILVLSMWRYLIFRDKHIPRLGILQQELLYVSDWLTGDWLTIRQKLSVPEDFWYFPQRLVSELIINLFLILGAIHKEH